MIRHLLSVLGYVVSAFIAQGVSHFVIFTRHYATISNQREEPIVALGLASMIIQGIILSYVYGKSRSTDNSPMGAVRLSWLFGAFLVSYIALAEPAHYTVPSIPLWFAIEGGVGFVQFTLAGLLLGLAHRATEKRSPAANTG